MSTISFPSTLTVIVESDWGVGTGTGIAGNLNSTVEKDPRRLPVIRATVLTGLLREQASIVALALDGGSPGPWCAFSDSLFGDDDRRAASFPAPSTAGGQIRRPRAIVLTDATIPHAEAPATPEDAVHEVVSLSIDEDTGTAKEDHLRFLERARPCTLTAQISLLKLGLRGQSLGWNDAQRNGVALLLSAAALLIQGVGSNRSDGDGACKAFLGDPDDDAQKAWARARSACRSLLEELTGSAPAPLNTIEEPDSPRLGPASHPSGAPVTTGPAWYSASLDIELLSPVVSYDVPMSNEIRSLDFLRGTVLLPWVHRQLRSRCGDAVGDSVRDAVVSGQLLVSDALPVSRGRQGLPVPLVLSSPKVEDDPELLTISNGLRQQSPNATYRPLRSGYLFLSDDDAHTIGAPSLIGRQSTAHNPTTGAAESGQLFLVRALPAGMSLRATITLAQPLHDLLMNAPEGGLASMLRIGKPVTAHLGSRRLSGTFGRAACTIAPFTPVEAGPIITEAEAPVNETTIWLTSDTLVRSDTLGPGGTPQDLIRAFQSEGVHIELATPAESCLLPAGLRHRRIDSWSAAEQQPRPTRNAIASGSVLRVRAASGHEASEVWRELAECSAVGIGELRAQGFGRFIVGSPFLDKAAYSLARLHQADFLPASAPTRATDAEETTR